jgi:membrane dipeptidase
MLLSRRSALNRLVAAGTAGIFWQANRLMAAQPVTESWHNYLDQASLLLGRRFSLDMHMHPALFPVKDIPRSSNPRPYRGDNVFASRIEGMREGQMWTGFFSPVVDAPVLGMTPRGPGMIRPFERGEAWNEFKRQIAVLDELLRRNGVVKAETVADVEVARAAGNVAAIYGCEGGDHIEDKPERVEEIFAAGVRSLQIYHVAPNSLIKTDGNTDNGLSDIGRETLQEMNRIGLLADLAHASFETTAAAAEISTQPILSTHSVVRSADGTARSFGMTAEHAKLIAGTGGVIGTFGGVRGGMAGFVEHVLRLIDTVGIEHVGIGTDMDGTGNLPAAFDRYPQLPEVAARLLASGLHENEVAKVIGGNVARVLEEVRDAKTKI